MNFKPSQAVDITARVGIANTQATTQTTSNPYVYNAWSVHQWCLCFPL